VCKGNNFFVKGEIAFHGRQRITEQVGENKLLFPIWKKAFKVCFNEKIILNIGVLLRNNLTFKNINALP